MTRICLNSINICFKGMSKRVFCKGTVVFRALIHFICYYHLSDRSSVEPTPASEMRYVYNPVRKIWGEETR